MRHSTRGERQRRPLLGVVVLVVLGATACNPIFGATSGPVQHATLTSDTGDRFAYSGDEVAVTAAAGAPFPSANVRELFWKTDSPFYADQQSCMTWDTLAYTDPGAPAQPGLALRIAPTGADGKDVKAITVNENISFAAVWYIWVNTWDTSRPGNPFNGVEMFDVSPIVGKIWVENGEAWSTLVEEPWHVCARTSADQLTFKLWTGENPEPGWDDPVHVFSTTLPPGWDHAGYSGGYIGHLHENQTSTFRDFSTMPLCLAPGMAGSPACQVSTEGAGQPS